MFFETSLSPFSFHLNKCISSKGSSCHSSTQFIAHPFYNCCRAFISTKLVTLDWMFDVLQLAASRCLKFCTFLDFKYRGWWECGERLAGFYPYKVSDPFSLFFVLGQLKKRKNCSRTNMMTRIIQTISKKLSFGINMKSEHLKGGSLGIVTFHSQAAKIFSSFKEDNLIRAQLALGKTQPKSADFLVEWNFIQNWIDFILNMMKRIMQKYILKLNSHKIEFSFKVKKLSGRNLLLSKLW